MEKVKSLLEKMLWLQPLTKKSYVPVLQYIKFENGTAQATDLVTYAMVPVNIGTRFLIDARKFIAFLKNINPNSGIIISGLDEKNRVTIYVDGIETVRFMSENPDDFPVNGAEKENIVISGACTNYNTFKRIFIAEKFTEENDLRPALCKVMVRDNEIAATNGHYLYRNKDVKINMGGGKILLPKDTIRVLSKFIHATMSITENYAIFKSDDKIVSVKMNTGEIYPDIDQVYPEYTNKLNERKENSGYISIEVDRSELKKAVKAALITSNIVTKMIVIRVTKNGTLFVEGDNHDEGESGKFILDSIRFIKDDSLFENKDYIIGINGKFMLQALQASNDEYVDIVFGKNNKAVLIDKSKVLMMPVLLPEYAWSR